jgi:hypothetical protein
VPVNIEVQAGGVTEGMVDTKGPYTPSSIILDKQGKLPFFTQGKMKLKVAASSPMARTFTGFVFF